MRQITKENGEMPGMLKLRKGNKVPFPEMLSEGYMHEDDRITANVSADKLKAVLAHFIAVHKEPLFFILELPSNLKRQKILRPGVMEAFQNDVYYIDGCTQEKAVAILEKTADILINDGMSSFGFGCHESHDEIMVGKYNVVTVFCSNPKVYEGFFEQHEIHEDAQLVTAWDTFRKNHYGESKRVDTDGKNIFDIPDMLKDMGIFLAGKREA